MERKRIFAISGVKNSGKTTLICKLLEIFKEKGLKVAVLKHDGHDFEPDVPGTDTYRQLQAGAYGTAVFSAGKYMLVKQQPQISESELVEFFPEADLILLEGFKYSDYPKIEIIRKGNSMTLTAAGEFNIFNNISVQLHFDLCGTGAFCFVNIRHGLLPSFLFLPCVWNTIIVLLS